MFDQDLAVFFGAEFASAAVLGGVPVTGIFDRDVEVTQVGEIGVIGRASTFTVPSSAAGEEAEGKPLLFPGRLDLPAYLVDEARPDGTGVTVLILKRAD